MIVSPLGERTKNWESIVARRDGVWAPVTSVRCGRLVNGAEMRLRVHSAVDERKQVMRQLSNAQQHRYGLEHHGRGACFFC